MFGQQWDGDVRIVLLVRLRRRSALDDELRRRRSAPRIRTRAARPGTCPRSIVAVDDLPRTRSGKLVELAVADAVNGRPVRNREAIANPEAIDAIAAVPSSSRRRSRGLVDGARRGQARGPGAPSTTGRRRSCRRVPASTSCAAPTASLRHDGHHAEAEVEHPRHLLVGHVALPAGSRRRSGHGP